MIHAFQLYSCSRILSIEGTWSTVPESIVSDQDAKFTARFCHEVHRIMGTRLLMSMSFHPQSDRQSERVIWLIGQIL